MLHSPTLKERHLSSLLSFMIAITVGKRKNRQIRNNLIDKPEITSRNDMKTKNKIPLSNLFFFELMPLILCVVFIEVDVLDL